MIQNVVTAMFFAAMPTIQFEDETVYAENSTPSFNVTAYPLHDMRVALEVPMRL